METNQEKKLKLDSVEITEKERFRAHPIRYVLSIPFAVAEVYFLILFMTPIIRLPISRYNIELVSM